MEIAILGPVEVRIDGVLARVRRRQQRLLVAALALDANAIVSIDRITALLWEVEPPERARAQIHVHISTLRRLLAGVANTAMAIETHPEGYRLRVPPASVDLVCFGHLVAQAQAAAEAGQLAEASRSYRDALGLWRGPALDGLTGRFAESEAARLNERRITVLKHRVDIDLVLGRYTDLVAELTGAVGGRPLDEDLRRRLILALYGSGRAADALAEYRQARQIVNDQLGIDQPGEQLRAIHDAILRNKPIKVLLAALIPLQTEITTADSSISKPIPQQLPGDIGVFTGRVAELSHLRTHLASSEAATPTVCAISGAGGIGKSALAIHAAHALREHFPTASCMSTSTARRSGSTRWIPAKCSAAGCVHSGSTRPTCPRT